MRVPYKTIGAVLLSGAALGSFGNDILYYASGMTKQPERIERYLQLKKQLNDKGISSVGNSQNIQYEGELARMVAETGEMEKDAELMKDVGKWNVQATGNKMAAVTGLSGLGLILGGVGRDIYRRRQSNPSR